MSPAPELDFTLRGHDNRPVKVIRPATSCVEVLVAGIAALRRYGGLLSMLALLRLKVRYKQSILGWLWAALQPLTLMVTYTIVFSLVGGVETGGLPYPLFVFAGLLPWAFFSTSVSTSTAGVIANKYLITKVYFPREIIPLSYVAAALVDFLIALLLLGGLMLYYRVPVTPNALYAVPIVAMLAMCVTATCLCLCALEIRFRDIGVAMPLLLQLLMFSSPIVYPITAVPATFRAIYMASPIAAMIDNFRRVIVIGDMPDGASLVYCALLSSVFLVASYILFKKLDATSVDVI